MIRKRIKNMYKIVLLRSVLVLVMVLISGSAVLAQVALTDLESKIKLDNDIVSATFEKSSARMISLNHNGDELLGNGGCGYLQIVVDGKLTAPSNAVYSVTANDSVMADISHKWSVGALNFDYHYVLRSGDSGIYSYMTIEYDPSRAAAAEIEQITYVLRTDKEIFNRMYIEDDRIFDMPTPEEIKAGKTLSPPEATLLKNGKVDHKYDFSNFMKDTDVHGWTGRGKGHWMIFPSNEYVNGGPTHQELTAHQTTKTPATLRQYHAAHYGAGKTNLDSSDGAWKKFYGPWMIYLNEGDGDDMWTDAKKKVSQEKRAWPYSWVKNSLYPLAGQRSRVTGKLNITDGSSAAGAMIILAQPTDGSAETNWQRQGKDYYFWTEAAADGSFTIDKVRPGEYTLYSFVSGVFGEYQLNGVKVKAGSKKELGELSWTPRKHGEQIWQIGVPDRTAAEYLHGDDYQKWGLGLEYPKDFSNGVNFTIGKSKEATDWNFNQWCIENGTDKRGRKKYQPSPWTINFDMDKIAGDQGVLTIGIASARYGRLKVTINGTAVFEGELENGGAAHRGGIQGFYEEKIIKFDSSILKANSANKIVLEQLRGGHFQSIMYDCIRLETSNQRDCTPSILAGPTPR